MSHGPKLPPRGLSKQVEQVEKEPAAQLEVSADICTCSGRGDLEGVQRLLDGNPQLAQTPDAEGRYPLHWAALNNELAVLHCLLKFGARVESRDKVGMTALHWAAFHGALACLEALVQAGGQLGWRDSQGYTVGHVAAQHGQIAMLHRLVVRYTCDWEAQDSSGRTLLHWAAYNGHADVIRFLVVLGADIYQTDRLGSTALHCAASRGEVESCDLLVQAAGNQGPLQISDGGGLTPAGVARCYHHVLLASRMDRQELLLQHRTAAGFKPESLLAPATWAAAIISSTVFTWKVIGDARLVPPPAQWMRNFGLLSVLLVAVGLIALYKLNIGDPGFVPHQKARLKGAGESLVEYLDCPTLRSGHWKQLCVTCKIVRPLRAKHDPNTGRCVEVFDHFCPWIGNVVGRKNRHIFLVFIIIEFVGQSLAFVIAAARLHQAKLITRSKGHFVSNANAESLTILAWLLCSIPIQLALLNLVWFQTFQVLRNMTTNEYISWPRYPHFRHPVTANFFNPFDAGPVQNMHETCFPEQYASAPSMLDEEALRARLVAGAGSCSAGCCKHEQGDHRT